MFPQLLFSYSFIHSSSEWLFGPGTVLLLRRHCECDRHSYCLYDVCSLTENLLEGCQVEHGENSSSYSEQIDKLAVVEQSDKYSGRGNT